VPGGLVLALKGSKAQDEIDESRPLIKKLKLETLEIVTVGQNLLPDPTTVVRVRLL
jgi:16S rRNA (guanine527-N7)-methyltransferase